MRSGNPIHTDHNLVTPLGRAFEKNAARACVIVDTDRLCGGEVLQRVTDRQAQLTENGIKRGDFVLVLMGRGIQVWIDYLALWGIGAVAVACDDDSEFVTHAIALTEPSAVCGASANLAQNTARLKQIDDGGTTGGRAQGSADVHVTAVGHDDFALVLFTSGSTGLPKAVPLTHGALADNAHATIAAIDIDAHRHLFAPVPFRFISGISHFLATVIAGVCYQGTEQRFLQAELIAEFKRSGADAFGGSPLQARWMAQAASEITGRLKWIMASGDHFPESIISTLRRDVPGIKVITAYGLTELAGRFCVQNRDDVRGSVGKPIAGFSLKLIDADAVMPDNRSGHVYVCGDMVFGGYLKGRQQDDSVISAEGFDTGDIGQLDDDGLLWLTGRSDDVFKSGAVKVSIQPIIAGLMSLDIFDDVAVIAVVDKTLGHVPHAFYTLKPSREFDRGSVMRALRQQLDKGHLPRYFSNLDQIPRTASGKVKRASLRTLAERAENR